MYDRLKYPDGTIKALQDACAAAFESFSFPEKTARGETPLILVELAKTFGKAVEDTLAQQGAVGEVVYVVRGRSRRGDLLKHYTEADQRSRRGRGVVYRDDTWELTGGARNEDATTGVTWDSGAFFELRVVLTHHIERVGLDPEALPTLWVITVEPPTSMSNHRFPVRLRRSTKEDREASRQGIRLPGREKTIVTGSGRRVGRSSGDYDAEGSFDYDAHKKAD